MMNRKDKQTLGKIKAEMNGANENMQMPEQLSKESIVSLVSKTGVSNNPQQLDSRRNVMPLYRITAMAAALAVVLGCALGASILKESRMDIAGNDVIVGEIRNARNYDEIKQIFLGQVEKATIPATKNPQAQSTPVPTAETVTDVEPETSGATEATTAFGSGKQDLPLLDDFEYDGSIIVKSDGEFIYMASKTTSILSGRESPHVVIMRANPVDSMQTVATVDLPVVTDELVQDSIIRIEIESGKMIVVVDRLTESADESGKNATIVYVYNIADKTAPLLERSLIQDGKYVDFLISAGKLYAVSNYMVSVDAENDPAADSLIPSYIDNGVHHLVDAGQIYCGITNPESSYLVITTADIADFASPVSVGAILGCDRKIYFSENTLVATRRFSQTSEANVPEQYTELYCFDITENGIKFKGSNVVEGISTDLISVDAFNGSIKIAAEDTVGKAVGESIYVFSDKMDKISRYSRVD